MTAVIHAAARLTRAVCVSAAVGWIAWVLTGLGWPKQARRRASGWLVLCTNSGNCAQIKPLPGGGMAISSTRKPRRVAELDAGEWAELVAAIRDGLTIDTTEGGGRG